MADLTLEDIINIHDEIRRRFNITAGIKDKGLLDSIAERPEQTVYSHVPFPDIYSKCASLMEAIIKWHPFIDGNKRTGLAVASAYMYKNKHALLLPFSAVRFSVQIARNEKDLNDITEWIRELTAGSFDEYMGIFKGRILDPVEPVVKLLESKKKEDQSKGAKIMSEWLAYDIYPEYAMENAETIHFIRDLLSKAPPTEVFQK